MAATMGLGADPNVDKVALDQLHALAVAIADARKNGDTAREAALRAQFNQAATVYSGFTASQLDAEVTAASAANDPLGLKTAGTALGQGLFWLAVAIGGYLVLTKRGPSARREW